MFLPEFDHQALENLLERYHSYCIISNAGRFVRGLRTLYIQCKEMLELLPQMNFFLKGRRFVYFEEISAYYMIHICSLALENHYGHNKLVYLAGPASMEVIRYDRAHGTDLLNFLYEYLESGCSIADTAERLHMHRNTVNNRIKKVEECIGVDIRNPQVCLELTNSCRIMMYAEHVSQQEYNIELQKTEQSSLKQKLSPAIFFLYSTEPVLLQNNSPQAIQTDTIPATGSQNCKDLSPVLEYLSESPVGL